MPPKRPRTGSASASGEPPAKLTRADRSSSPISLPSPHPSLSPDPDRFPHWDTWDSSSSSDRPPGSLGFSSDLYDFEGFRIPIFRYPWAKGDDNGDAPKPGPGDGLSGRCELYGIVRTKINGIRYYQGRIKWGEKVILHREPSNPYDHNAIRVDNVMQSQIGHIPKTLAAKIAPYIDSGDIVLDGLIAGHKGPFDCPVHLLFYGTSDPEGRLRLGAKLKADKLIGATQLKDTRREADAQRHEAVRLRVSATTFGSGDQEDPLRELIAESQISRFRSEISSDDLSSFDVLTSNEDALSQLPKAQQPEAIQSQLLPYQLQSLAWMTAKENPQPPSPGSKDIVQLWKRTKNGNFVNLISNHITKDPPNLASGGLLADDMGLGKTLQVISLIMSSGFKEGSTLIVAPLSVMSNWEQQIQHHVKDTFYPSVFRYHKPGNYTSRDLEKHNIVITTYDKIRSDRVKNGPLFEVNWRRIVLDEAHAIRNYSTSRAQAVFRLNAKSRWMLSGTPIVNSTKDFLSVLKFLRVTGGADEASFFIQLIDDPISNGPRGRYDQDFNLAKKLFQLMTTDLCLRRRKDMQFINLKLPTKTEYIHRIQFREDEQDKYEALRTQTTEILDMYRRRDANFLGGPRIRFSSIFQKLLRLRQMCCHWTLCGGQVKKILSPLEKEKVVPFTPENVKILQAALVAANNEGEECPICTEALSLHDPIITACKHRFGKACLLQAFERNKSCPMCRQQLTEDSLTGLPPVSSEDKFDGDTRSTKTEALEKILRAKLQDPKSKVVIFSQWTSFLSVIAKLLDEGGYKYCRIEGSMTGAKRDASIKALNDDPDTRIMLASLAASGVGLNLVAADTVILTDSWWAPALEDQAVDRVHRLGQTRPVTVWKLVMEDTVEDRVLKIQAKKRQIANLALKDPAREQEQETDHLDDVLQLLS
ncbi:SNF2 family N-terminal domain-containing protein [Annulohypoxylon nitens]|nr:SNF2 family N-terminal domain-containing protein [Annulohypoxylon nitens]